MSIGFSYVAARLQVSAHTTVILTFDRHITDLPIHRGPFYSSFHNRGPLVSERSVRNPKLSTAGFKVKSKNKTLKIPYLVRIRLMG